jgi:hypothetical protein
MASEPDKIVEPSAVDVPSTTESSLEQVPPKPYQSCVSLKSTEQYTKALEKDWSNYLLITTTAALGWVATTGSDFSIPGIPLFL